MAINDVKHLKVLKLFFAIILALGMTIFCPRMASAGASSDEATTETVEETVDGYMTITLQEQGSSNSDQATEDKNSSGKAANTQPTSASSNQSDSSGKTVSDSGSAGGGSGTSLAKTGDMVLMLCLGIASLMFAGVFICFKARVLAKGRYIAEYPGTREKAKKQILIAGTVAIVIACSCFGLFAGKQAAFAEEQAQKEASELSSGAMNDSAYLSSSITVDGSGNVLDNGILFGNKSQWTLTLGDASAPDEFEAWKSSFENKTSSPGKENMGQWSTQGVPTSVLE